MSRASRSGTSRLCQPFIVPKTEITWKSQIFLYMFYLIFYNVILHDNLKNILDLWCVITFLKNIFLKFIFVWLTHFQLNTFFRKILPKPSDLNLNFWCNPAFPFYTLLWPLYDTFLFILSWVILPLSVPYR